MDNSNANSNNSEITKTKVALITGGAKRIGAAITKELHQAGYNVIIHCRLSRQTADNLAVELNLIREDSAHVIQGDLNNETIYDSLIDQSYKFWKRLDALVNNASSFHPTPIGSITLDDWDNLINSNMRAPLFLAQAAAPHLKHTQGCIINIIDVHAQRPMKNHPVYCAAKAGLQMITLSLAKDLGPEIRVNGVAPGAILWPENDMSEHTKNLILERTSLKRPGQPIDIAKTIVFLAKDADYITGQIIAVDGGRSLNI
ncbi:FolM Alternative dihydrofolate reductase 1 [hydrothermal vent metagenome]|uniref:FolM Alternative dihydrofolate reductase 1 n=1 Tax=hydrothermal vent metagenome TaxID=652676 RepID=A0A3B0WHV3_9ZZZZ